MKYKIIVAHPGRQHSYRLASAYKKNNMLSFYITTIYDKKKSNLMKIVKKFLSRDNRKRACNRRNNDLSDKDVIQYMQYRGLIETLLFRVDKNKKIYNWLQRLDADRFGIRVAKKAIKEGVDAVVMYDVNSLEGFKYLEKHAPNIVRIQDVSIVPRPYMKKIYQDEIDKSGRNDLKIENSYLWNDKLLSRLQKEIEYTQYFFAASKFVKEGLQFCGAADSQIKVVPYGANVESDVAKKDIDEEAKLEILFVGQVIYRKGVPYLLESVGNFEDEVNLTVTGAYNERDWFVKENINKKNVNFTGLVTIDKMQEIYEKSDVFVIPSFAEGMAQVGIEAMSCGVPIICTFNSGVADLVEDGKNGFVIPCGDSKALDEKIKWFIDNKGQIRKMGEEARQIARKYTWDNYEKNIVSATNEILQGKYNE